MDATPAVRQAECTECDDEDAEFNVIARDYEMTPDDDEDAHVTRTVRCDNCKSTGTVSVGFDGTTPGGCVTFENASWNQTDDEGDDE